MTTMRKIFWFLSLLATLVLAIDISQIDPSTLTPEQLKAFNAYKAGSSQSAKSDTPPTVQTLINSEISKPPLPRKDLDLSAPTETQNIDAQSKVPFTTPLQYETNQNVYKSLQAQKVQKVDKNLQKFGESFFKNNNSVNPYSIPTSENYMLTNGDKISVHIYGQQATAFDLLVDRNGNVELPNIGILKVANLKYADAKKLIEEQLQKAYPQSTFVLDIAYYNTIQVMLTGEVRSPGLYNLPSFATIKDLLMIANGINANGSYRDILLKRNGQTIEHFDAYKLILSGDQETPKLLQNGDVVTVSKAHKQVKLLGEVSNPALFELKNDEMFKSLFNYASGFTYNANKNVMRLTRFSDNEKIKVYTLNYKKLLEMKPQDGDAIEVFSLASSLTKTVTLVGNVIQEGAREIPEDAKLSTLLNKEIAIYGKNNFFLENTAFDLGMVKRKKVDGNNEIVSFDVNHILEHKHDVTLKENDEIYIPNKLQVSENPYIHIDGIVVENPGRYQYFENMELQSLFKNIQFKTEMTMDNTDDVNMTKMFDNNSSKVIKKNHITKPVRVNQNYIKLIRITNNAPETIALNLNTQPHFKLKAFDRLEFFDIYTTTAKKNALIAGEVYNPGSFDIQSNTTIEDMINFAGGLTKKAFIKDVELARFEVVDNVRVRKVFKLNLNNPTDRQMHLHDEDQIIIRGIPKWNEKKYIELVGQVTFPGKYPIEEGETLADVLVRAGGFTDLSFLKGAVFTRKSVQELQIKEMERALRELQQQASYIASVPSSDGKDNNTANKAMLTQMIASLQADAEKVKPIGRVVIALKPNLDMFRQSNYNIPLEDGDRLYIPRVNKTVTVLGEVLSPNSFIFDDKLALNDYIAKAGSFKKEMADKESIYIIKSNGDAQRVDNGYLYSSNAQLEYGDTIIVPRKIEVTSNLSLISAIADITYKMAVTIASLNTVGAI